MSPRNNNNSNSNFATTSILESYAKNETNNINNQSALVLSQNRNGPIKANNASSTNFLFGSQNNWDYQPDTKLQDSSSNLTSQILGSTKY